MDVNPKFLWAAVVALIIGLLGVVYMWIDKSISLSYMESSVRATEDARTQTMSLLLEEWNGKPSEEIFQKLSQSKKNPVHRELVLKRERSENAIVFGSLRFIFLNDQLKEIR